MPQLPPTLQHTSWTTIVLWAAFALLSIALLVLMRTRWGQARPLSKCVMLSLAAHMLLIGFASVTRLFSQLPPGPEQTFTLSFQAGDHAEDEQSTAPEQAQPWERPVITPSPTPPEEAVPRISETAEPLPVAPVDEPAEVPGEGLPADVPAFTEASSTAQPAFEVAAVPREMQSEASAIDVPDRQQPSEATEPEPAPAPEVDSLHRPGIESQLPEPASPSADPSPPTPASDATQQVQELAGAAIRTSPADAVAAAQDNLQAADNESLHSSQTTAPAATLVQITPSSSSNEDGSGEQPAPVAAETAPPVADVARVPVQRPGGGELPEIYRPRVSPDRDELARRFGGNAATQAAVDAGLAWLAANQSDDGRWDPDVLEGGREVSSDQDRGNAGAQADTGITALAVLAFLGNGHTHLEGRYQRHVQHGLEFLLRSQAANGSMAGEASLFASMYCHGMATLAISEAYAVSGDRRLLPYVQRAVNYTISAQHPTTGGWRYQPGDDGDMSQFGWQLMALRSAELGGISVPDGTRNGMHRFLASACFGEHGGLAAYRQGYRASRTMTAEALLCRLFLETSNQESRKEAVNFIMQELPGDGRINLYYYYYATLSLHQLQDENWEMWNTALQARLLRGQRAEGPLAGSWDPDTQWGGYGGRAYSTAMATLCLEVYYRYLPLHGAETERR